MHDVMSLLASLTSARRGPSSRGAAHCPCWRSSSIAQTCHASQPGEALLAASIAASRLRRRSASGSQPAGTCMPLRGSLDSVALSRVTRVRLIHPVFRRRFSNNSSLSTVYIAVSRDYVLPTRSDEIMLARHSIYEIRDVASIAEVVEPATPRVDFFR